MVFIYFYTKALPKTCAITAFSMTAIIGMDAAWIELFLWFTFRCNWFHLGLHEWKIHRI